MLTERRAGAKGVAEARERRCATGTDPRRPSPTRGGGERRRDWPRAQSAADSSSRHSRSPRRLGAHDPYISVPCSGAAARPPAPTRRGERKVRGAVDTALTASPPPPLQTLAPVTGSSCGLRATKLAAVMPRLGTSYWLKQPSPSCYWTVVSVTHHSPVQNSSLRRSARHI